MIIGQRPLSSRHFFSSSSSHWHPTQNCCQCGQVFMFFFRTFGCEFDCRLLLGVVSCVMGAIKRSKTWTAQTQNYGTIRRGRKSHKRWLHKRTQFNPKSKNGTYILYVSLLKTIKKLTSHPLAGHSYPLSWCPRRREQVLFARAYRSLPVANITMAVTYIAGIVYFIS